MGAAARGGEGGRGGKEEREGVAHTRGFAVLFFFIRGGGRGEKLPGAGTTTVLLVLNAAQQLTYWY